MENLRKLANKMTNTAKRTEFPEVDESGVRNLLEFCKTVHEPIGRLIVHLEKAFELFSGFCLLLFVLCKAGQKRNDQP